MSTTSHSITSSQSKNSEQKLKNKKSPQALKLGKAPRFIKKNTDLHFQSENEIFQKLLDKNETFLDTMMNQDRKNPLGLMLDATIEEIKGRQIRIGKKWLTDWASCNYLGFDLEPEIMNSIAEKVQKWGTHPSWSRLLGTPKLYIELEEKLTELLGCEDCLVVQNISQLSTELVFILSEGGEIFLDKLSHRTLYEGGARARAFGSTMTYFSSDNLDDLEKLLKKSKSHRKVICVDGVYSMHGKYPNVPKIAALARKYDALVYLDDAHGFGIIGERNHQTPQNHQNIQNHQNPQNLLENTHQANELYNPYGSRGNSIIKYYNESYDNVIMVACLSKSYSSYGAFLTCTKPIKQYLKALLTSYLYSGPIPVASLATALAGLEVNEKRGDAIRLDLYQKSKYLNDAIRRLGYRSDNDTDFPIFNIYLENKEDLQKVTQFLFDRQTYVTLCPYPMVAAADVGFRVQVTAANTMEEIEQLISVLEDLPQIAPVQMEKITSKKTAKSSKMV